MSAPLPFVAVYEVERLKLQVLRILHGAQRYAAAVTGDWPHPVTSNVWTWFGSRQQSPASTVGS